MKRITKYVCLILSAVVTVLLFGTDTKAYAAQNQEMNLYGIYVNSNEKGDSVLLESKGIIYLWTWACLHTCLQSVRNLIDWVLPILICI